ncbi:MAG: dihydroorotate dehydrogenase, partial [Clostridiaceae bacterium]|nr:dihydroorotate dehydrogenase [Clostridiaceae bacterium]
GREMAAIWDIRELGGIVSKGLTPLPREGNAPPRVAETASGMLNSVGLQNPGMEAFVRHELPFMLSLGIPVVVNAAGHCVEDYVILCQKLDQTDIAAIELNLSCPNVRSGCMSIGTDPEQVREVVRAARTATAKPLWVKLTPNVTHVDEIATAAQNAGADAICLINTLLGMQIDIHTRRPLLANNTGGLSGPAVKPVAVRMVYEVAHAVRIPVIGIGGIQSAEDAIEFILAGATAVQVGSANLVKPTACKDIIENIEKYMEENNITAIRDLIGAARRWE